MGNSKKSRKNARATSSPPRAPTDLLHALCVGKARSNAAVMIKHDVNHFGRENNGNATARQKPIFFFALIKKQWKIKKLEKESPPLRQPGVSRRRQ